MSELALADAGLRVKDGCLLKLDAHENTVASIPLTDIEQIRCRKSFSFSTLLFVGIIFWFARFMYTASDMFWLRWIVAPFFGFVAAVLLVSVVIENELEVRTKHGSSRFHLPGDLRDARAFALTVAELTRADQAK